MVLVMLCLACEIAGRPVTFEEAGIHISSVYIELSAFFNDKRKKWILMSAVGRQLGICNGDGTVSADEEAPVIDGLSGDQRFFLASSLCFFCS